jgi:amino acid adenylation domain-containing protein
MSAPSFVERFEAQVDLTPSATAVTLGSRSLTYVDLDARANRLAHQLIASGVASDDVVAIATERSLEALVGILGVLKAGAGYLALDPGYPAERLRFMVEDARPSLVLRQRGVALSTHGAQELELDLDSAVLTLGNASRPSPRHHAGSIAYAIYTSGSTGKPKGVAMVHGALDNLIDWQLRDSRATLGTVTLQFAPLSFDVHFQEIFSTWCSGGRLVLVSEELRLEMLRLLELLEREQVSRLFLPFIALQSLADIAVGHGRLPRSLREVITAGEQLQITRAIAELFSQLPDARLFNHYGPSETHVVTSHLLEGPPDTWPALPPIGRALPDVTLAVLREDGVPVEPGQEGELFLGGVALARGYLYRPELTAERFVTLGDASAAFAGQRFYKTGDLVKDVGGGVLQFLGRLDGQVKVRGYRIELGEIEVALSAHTSVKEAAAAVYEPTPGDKRIGAWVVLEEGADIAALRRSLQDRLPEYMLPSAFVTLPQLPRTPSGKVDKRSLPTPTSRRPALSSEPVPPTSALEQSLLKIWESVLGLAGLGTHDNFFELGGNSLLALRAAAATEKMAAKPLPITRFFQHPTIAGQAGYLTNPDAAATGVRRVSGRALGAGAPIAIVGMAGRFPGATSLTELWRNLFAGVESVETFDAGDLGSVPAVERDDPAYVAKRGVINEAGNFDAAFFGVPPNEAALIDPQQRLLLELSWHALENAGYAPNRSGRVVGVYAGTHNNTYYLNAVLPRPDAIQRIGTFGAMVASEKDYVATRIAHKLDLTGPALSIHTACSTSLVAVATAVQHLRDGLCDMAIAGGASLSVPQRVGHVYQEGGMLSRDGHTRTFDASATGTLFSDGAAMIVLKPLPQALADGDHVYAVVRGVGVNNDGGHKASFTAPSVEGQAAVVGMALSDAGLSARDIDYVEAHGTATPLGDPIEVDALTTAFRAHTNDRQYCGIGSIKSNFGHVTAAAGVAGLIKVALSLQHENLPPTLHYQSPNPSISFDASPFFVIDRTRPWPRTSTPRRAGVSSFGVGGTNAHAVVEEAPVATPSGPSIAPQLLLLSAKTEAALQRATLGLADWAASEPSAKLADAAYTLAVGRARFLERRAVVASSLVEAAARLRDGAEAARGKAPPTPPKVAFMFPGQGSQYVDMGRNLYETEALFRLVVDECAEILRERLGRDLRDVLYPKADREAAAALLQQTELTQSALFVVEYALARTLMSWGVQPDHLIGHSIGEFVAGCLAGIFDLESALHLVAARGQLMQSMPAGAMLSVRIDAASLRSCLPAELDLAAENAPGLCVVAGPLAAVERFQTELQSREIVAKLLATSHAFHSRSMDAAAERFLTEVQRVKLSPPSIPIASTATGAWLRDEEATDPVYWSTHLRRPVLFARAARTAAEKSGVLLEVGPRRSLATLVLQRQPGDTTTRPTTLSCFTDRADDNAEWKALLAALGRSWVAGIDVDWPAFFQNEQRKRVPMPGYSFEPTRHWLDAPSAPTQGTTRSAVVLSTEPAPAPSAAVVFSSPASPPESHPMSTSPAPARTERLVAELKEVFQQVSGIDFTGASPDISFIEQGVDSLLITQLATKVKQTYKVAVSFRQLMEDLPSFASLAGYLSTQLPPEAQAVAAAPALAAAPVAAATPIAAAAQPAPALPSLALPAFAPAQAATGGAVAQLFQLQLAQLALLQQQLALVMGGVPAPVGSATAPVVAATTAPAAAANASSTHATASAVTAAVTQDKASDDGGSDSAARQISYDPKKAFGAIARIYKQSDAMSPKQLARLEQLTQRYTRKTAKSKAHTQEHRRVHADPRVVTGFKPRIKELIYPIVTSRSEGCRLWDLDGNEYIDALNGFGSNYFGYAAKFLNDAMKARLDAGAEIGPQTPLAGESAKLFCELTGMQRAAFCNTGSEAVMGALRIARTVTGRGLVVAFAGSYHGIFDEVIVRDTKNQRSIPAAPGIMAEAVQNMLVLEYGTPESLAIIKGRGEELAAVLVEPVQSRRPDFQPREFLRDLRQATRSSGTALIFDEVITGFRVHPGGAQRYFDIDADLATYGKIVGGGMPIGVIAGRDPWMDALDGGFWQYGDDSIPTAGVTYFAGTFVRHPLAMTAVHAVLQYMKEQGPALQERVNARTTAMAGELNAFFKSVGAPLEIRHFASLWKTFFTEPQPYGELLFCYLRDRGIHIWDGFPCFLTLAHGDLEVEAIVQAFKESVRELQAGDFLPGTADGANSAAPFDATKPPVAGARLGRDPQGNPAWFVPKPDAPGQYTQVS